jgi:hypothetical protein
VLQTAPRSLANRTSAEADDDRPIRRRRNLLAPAECTNKALLHLAVGPKHGTIRRGLCARQVHALTTRLAALKNQLAATPHASDFADEDTDVDDLVHAVEIRIARLELEFAARVERFTAGDGP